MLGACLDGIRRVQAAAPAEPAGSQWNRVLLYVWPPIDLAARRARRGRAPPRAARPRASASSRSSSQAGCADAGRRRAARARRCASSLPAGRGRHRRGRPTRRPSRCSRSTSTPSKVAPPGAAARVYPYELVPLLRRRDAAATFVEHDLDDDGALGAGRPPARRATRAGIVVGVVTHADRALPGGHDPGARCSATRPRRSARSPSPSAGGSSPRSTSPSELGVPGRVVRAVGRRQDRHGQRHREHGLDRRACCAGSSSSPRPAARSTSSSPASTSAPSRTGTPRRRC